MLLPDYEKLLHLISVQGQVGIAKFHEFFDQLYPASIDLGEDERYFARFQTIRFLEALGHCEYDYENRRLYACRPVITLQSSWGMPQGILSGARSPSLLSNLREFAAQNKENLVLKETRQPYYPVIPAAITLKATTLDMLERAATYLGISCDLDHTVSSKLLDFSCNVEQMHKELKFEQSTELNWPKLVFSTKTLSFAGSAAPNSSNLLVEYTNRVSRRKVHLVWNNGRGAGVERDWGRFIVLFLEKINVLLYNKKKFQLLVPATIPLPALIARAVTLKSGMVPVEKTIGRKRYWIYGGIDPVFAIHAVQKLGQIPHEI
jgi:hypothetical protein